MTDWQLVSSMAASFAVVIAICALIHEVRSSRKERLFSTFIKLVDYYSGLIIERRKKWMIIKERVKTNSRIEREIGDKTSTIEYLLIRSKQEEPMYAIEHSLLEDDIRSLNLLNELCKLALKDELKALLLKVLFSGEICYYQNRLRDLLAIHEREKEFRLFSKPKYIHLQKLRVDDYFGTSVSSDTT